MFPVFPEDIFFLRMIPGLYRDRKNRMIQKNESKVLRQAAGIMLFGVFGLVLSACGSAAAGSSVSPLVWSAAALGTNHSLWIINDQSLYGWGDNRYGQVGTGSTSTQGLSDPVPVGSLNWDRVSAGEDHSLGITAAGSLYSWGGGDYGQLGTNDTELLTPSLISFPDTSWRAISAGYYHSLAVSEEGKLYGWGYNSAGQVGYDSSGSNVTIPVLIGDKQWETVSAGVAYSMGITSAGELYAWGFYSYGRLGIGVVSDNQTSPQQVGSASGWSDISAGTRHTLGILHGKLYSWGSYAYGKLGLGAVSTDQFSPVQLGTESDWIAVAAGEEHSLALKSNGTLYAWGQDYYGQLGINKGYFNVESSPVQVGSDSDWVAVDAGEKTSMALKRDGTLWLWGYNGFGQLGDGTYTSSLIPLEVSY